MPSGTKIFSWNHFHQPVKVAWASLAILFLFGCVYWLLPDNFFALPKLPGESEPIKMGFWDWQYFSVVTITTLGYGEIYPLTGLARFIIALESLFGIIAIGFYLNALSYSHTERNENISKNIIKDGFRGRYKGFRLSIVQICLLTKKNTVTDEYISSLRRLIDGIEFRDYCSNDDQWKYIEELINKNKKICDLVERRLLYLSRAADYALNHIKQTKAGDWYNTLRLIADMSYSLETRKIETINHSRLITQHLWDIMTWSSSNCYLSEDPILRAIDEL